MDVRVLGPVQVHEGDRAHRLSGHAATLLGLLALDPGHAVPVDRLLVELWGADRATARSAVHPYVSRLRKRLTGTALALEGGSHGYTLTGDAMRIDLHAARTLVDEAESPATTPERAVDLTSRALALWRGTAFAGAGDAPTLERAADRVRALRRRALGLRAEALLKQGRAAEASQDAAVLVEDDPFDEGHRTVQVRALRRASGDAVALAAWNEYRALLADELGVEPGSEMIALHRDLLGPPSRRVAVRTERAGAAPAADPLVGRRRQREVLEDALASARAGAGRIVVLEGEAGIGKTRLARHALERAHELGLRVAAGRALPDPGTPALWPWDQALRGLRATLPDGASVASDGADAGVARFRLHQRVVESVLDAAEERPILLVLDDLQWADAGSVHVLRLLADAVWSRPIAVVVTSRPRTPHLAALRPGGPVVRCGVGPLTERDVAELVDLGPDGGDARRWWQRSAGNPFFLHELLRSGEQRLPTTVAEMFARRLDDLPPPTRRLVQATGIAGRGVPAAVLAHVVDASVADVLRDLEPAIADGVLVTDGPGVGFVHDLAREAVVAQVGAPEALDLHGRLADGLVAVHGDGSPEHVEAVATHRYAASGGSPSPLAHEACLRAAEHASARLDHERAAEHRARALQLAGPDQVTRAARVRLLMDLTRDRRLAGDVVGASASLADAIEMARVTGDRAAVREALAVLGDVTFWNWRQFGEIDHGVVAALEHELADTSLDPAERARLTGTLAVELYYQHDAERCARLAQESVTLGRASGDPVLLGRTLNNLVVATWGPSTDGARRAALDEALGLVGHGLPEATEVVARLHRAPLHLQAGDTEACAADLERADVLARRLGRPEVEGQVASQQVALAVLRGDHDAARETAERTHRLMSRTSLWGSEYVRLLPAVTMARIEGRLDTVVDDLVAHAVQDAHRVLRWLAIDVVARVGGLVEARAMQARWSLTRVPRVEHWASPIEWTHAAEVALQLGTPSPAAVLERLGAVRSPLVLAGSGLVVWGPVDLVRARLAESCDGPDDAAVLARRADDVTIRVAAGLGVTPSWPLR